MRCLLSCEDSLSKEGHLGQRVVWSSFCQVLFSTTMASPSTGSVASPKSLCYPLSFLLRCGLLDPPCLCLVRVLNWIPLLFSPLLSHAVRNHDVGEVLLLCSSFSSAVLSVCDILQECRLALENFREVRPPIHCSATCRVSL